MDTKVGQKNNPVKYIENILKLIDQNPGKRRRRAPPESFMKAIQSEKFIDLLCQCRLLRGAYLLVDQLTVLKE